MADPTFFAPPEPLPLRAVAEMTGARLSDRAAGERLIKSVAALDQAGPGDLAFLDNPLYAEQLRRTEAEACLVTPRFLDRVPAGVAALVTPQPYHAFAKVAAALYPAAARPVGVFGESGSAAGAIVHPTARLEDGVTVEPGAVIGARAEIGRGTVICGGAVVGHDVRIGRGCYIGPGATVIHALIGNNVIVHPGARIGQDGFGFALGPRGHVKVPQIGRVIVQNDVEIGANTTIDRGANRDTIVGEGTKIDNLVQIGHNVVIGRHCVIVAQVGISGSTVLEDFVVMGGKSSTVGHVRVGAGAQIAGASSVKDDVPPGTRWGGYPARPLTDWARELATLKKLAARRGTGTGET